MSINALSIEEIDLAQAKSIAQDFHHALRQGELREILPLLAQDVMVTRACFPNKNEILHDQYRLSEHITYFDDTRLNVLLQDILIKNSCAWVFSTIEAVGIKESHYINIIGVETMVLKRELLGWKIGHIHWLFQKIGDELVHGSMH